MEWWRGLLVGLAAAALTVGLVGVVCKKAYALGWATASIICSKISTPAATWFGKNWLWPALTSFRDGYKARLIKESRTKKGLTGFERAEKERERRTG